MEYLLRIDCIGSFAQSWSVTKRSCASEEFRQQTNHKENSVFKIFSTITLFGVLTVSASHAQSNQPIQAHFRSHSRYKLRR
jgi:hypothetical protein